MKHGHARVGKQTREYKSWHMMLQRCCNPNFDSYPRYGGRGIEVCEGWRQSFSTFLEDMGPRPADCTLDRYPNNNGNYEPGNCRWANLSLQQYNRRPTREFRTVTSQYIGVYWDRDRSLWKAQIACKGRVLGLGRFLDEAIAARVRDAATMELRGDEAVLNFPESTQESIELFRCLPKHVHKSKFRGISWSKTRLRWRVTVRAFGKVHGGGSFVSEEEAARAYDAAALLLLGSYARLNFIQQESSNESKVLPS